MEQGVFSPNHPRQEYDIVPRYILLEIPLLTPPMNLQIYRYGEPGPRVGLFIGVAHYLPRGVRREDYAARGYFDLWLPLLSPSRELVAAYREDRLTFPQFARRYRTEMRRAEPRQAIRLLAAVAGVQPILLGCFCADAARCHRSVLRDLVTAAAVELPQPTAPSGKYFSPACAMPEIED